MMRSMLLLDMAAPGPLGMLALGAALSALCVGVHAAVLVGLGRRLVRTLSDRPSTFAADMRIVVWVTSCIVFVHLFEIEIWALFYAWSGCLPDLPTAFYFSSVTYTTVGYGDVVLPHEWRNLSSAEALTGILMSGLSTAFLFGYFSLRFRLAAKD